MNEDFKRSLRKAVGQESVRTERAELLPYRRQVGLHAGAVVQVRSGPQASKVVKLANRFGVPFVTADSDGVLLRDKITMGRGFVLDVSGMNRIRAVRVADLCCVVEPGVLLRDLKNALDPHNFFFPPDPVDGGALSIGRVVMCNPPFPRGNKYGTVRNRVLGVEAVMPSGELLRLGTGTLKNSSGLQIERFLAGSGGPVGFPTEVTVQVMPRPEKQLLCVSAFDSLRGAAGAVAGIAASRVVPAALEVVDKSWIEANPVLKEFGQTDVLLFIELDGCAGAIKRESETVAAICRRTGASFLRRISREKKIEEWRESRRALDRFSRTGLVSGMKSVVPLPKMVDVLAGLRTIGERHGLAVLAHGYCLLNDFHAEVAVQPAEEEKVERLVSEILELADSLGGSASGPHGARAPRRSPDRVCLAIKRALDPNGIVNPLRRHHKRVVHC